MNEETGTQGYENAENLSFPHVPSPEEIAKRVAQEVVGPVVSQVGHLVHEALKRPDLKQLEQLANPARAKDFIDKVSPLANTDDFQHIIHEYTKMEPLQPGSLLSLTGSLKQFVDALNQIIHRLPSSSSITPITKFIEEGIDGFENAVNSLDREFIKLIKVPSQLNEIQSITTLINTQSKRIHGALSQVAAEGEGAPPWAKAVCGILLIVDTLLNWVVEFFNGLGNIAPISLTAGISIGFAAGGQAAISGSLGAVNVVNALTVQLTAPLTVLKDVLALVNSEVQMLA